MVNDFGLSDLVVKKTPNPGTRRLSSSRHDTEESNPLELPVLKPSRFRKLELQGPADEPNEMYIHACNALSSC